MTGLACNFLALKELGKDGDKPCAAPTFFLNPFPSAPGLQPHLRRSPWRRSWST